MGKYIALLRGINVGGKNFVSMTALKAAFEDADFTEVSTYINSGNVIFEASESAPAVLQDWCRKLLSTHFGLDIPVAILSAKALQEALSNAPDWWGQDPEAKHNVLLVIAPAQAEEILAAVGAAREPYEQVASFGSVIFWTAGVKTYSRTHWSKIVSHPVYASVTIRNANTAHKLAERTRRS